MDEELQRLVETGKLDPGSAEKIDRLKPGAFCLHKSWGTGEIDSWDLMGDRLIINFTDKPGHGMKLKFAANALEPLEEGHILAHRFRDSDELTGLAESDPVELVHRTLSSHGGTMFLDDLEDVLKGEIVPEGKYKSWWDSAKKKLRQDRRFVVPSKRNVPIELRDADITPAQAMISDVVDAPDLKAKAKAVETLLKDTEAFSDPVADLRPVLEDLNETASKAAKLMPSQAIELLLARDDLEAAFDNLELAEERVPLSTVLREERENLGEIVRSLGVARQRQVLESFPEAFTDDWIDVVFEMLHTAGMRGASELTKFLHDQGKEKVLEEYLVAGLKGRSLSSDLVAWVCKERKARTASIVDDELPAVIMASLERDHFDEAGRRANRLAEILQDDPDLIPDLVRDLELPSVRAFARRLMMSPVFDSLTVKSLLARIVKIHPQIQDLVVGSQDADESNQELIVSFKSLEEKQKELQHLVNVLQPKNREEIQIAREYGDLRENFEYKAAKQQEAVLRRKREDMERDIERARGTDFSEPDTSRASIGTIVEIEDVASGETETFTILGAWDSDPTKGIIAYTTKAGKALIGKRTGETANLPTEVQGKKRRVKVLSIRAYRESVSA